jgi:hypothetical protein
MGDGEEKGRYFLYSLSPLFFLLFIFFYLEELRETFFSFFLFGFFSSFHLFFREGKRGLIFWRGRHTGCLCFGLLKFLFDGNGKNDRNKVRLGEKGECWISEEGVEGGEV